MKLTPAMRQYVEVKEQYPDAIILFRMGDFYECFYEDAKKVSSILGITLTSRGKDDSKAPLAGIPYHSLDKYLKTLVDSKNKIVICEQLEDPKQAVGVVKRGVTRVITPGTVIEESALSEKSNNYILSAFCDSDQYGFAVCDISTGEFITGECENIAHLISEISRFTPSEILTTASMQNTYLLNYITHNRVFHQKINEYFFWITKASQCLKDHFAIEHIGTLGFSERELALCASGALLAYLKDSQKVKLEYIQTIAWNTTKNQVVLDQTAIRNLEILKNIRDSSKEGTLLELLDKTRTSMGGRLLRSWILRPLSDVQKIDARLSAVENLFEQQLIAQEIADLLSQCVDIERLISKISYGTANARDLVGLRQTLTLAPLIRHQLDASVIHADLLKQSIPTPESLIQLLEKALNDECPLTVREGGFIKRGFSSELDEYHSLATNTKEILAKLETAEIERTKIPTLKIKYNRVFGYFFEVTNKYKDAIPPNYVRKQSTVNSERFITPELGEIEVKMLSAQQKIHDLEFSMFQTLCEEIKKHVAEIQEIAHWIASIDSLLSLAQCAKEYNYTRPILHDGFELSIIQGRHPVLERTQKQFIPNDVTLTEQERMMIITGPNMAGKSTYMRQVALITLLAHIGSFVPAEKAKISLVDKIFTRVGSYDDISKGQSTFMVEMTEISYVLQNATSKSLLILDEIGSGTSTYDGVSIAWAVGIELAKHIKAKTLFSTHYHVLTKMEQEEGVFNVHTAVLEAENDITFLRKIVRGGTDKSYGIHVAKLAGLPHRVLSHAQKIMLQLEEDDELHDKIVVEKRATNTDADSITFSISKLKQKTLFDVTK